MKKIFKWIAPCAVALLILCGIQLEASAAETPTTDITMTVSSSAYQYNAKKAVTANRAGYRTFGEEVYVTNLTDEWAEIWENGSAYYMKRQNLDYKSNTVIKNRVMVSPGAYACSANSAKGYVFYGTGVSVLGETTTKKGVTYVHCVADKVYESDGTTVKGTSVEGYINAEYLAETAVPKIVNGGTNLYASAYGSASGESVKTPVGTITTGEEVQVLMSNKTWSKIRYNGSEYYMSTGKLDKKEMQILVKRVLQTYDAKPGSGLQHYVYWGTDITVLNTYESDKYGTYYYCKINGDYGFIREYSSSGVQYVGYLTEMKTNAATKLYAKASDTAAVLKNLTMDTAVTVEYAGDTWCKVKCDGQTGFIPTAKLSYVEYEANGAVYDSGYKMIKKNSSGTVNGTVSLIGKYTGRGYAKILDESGSEKWMYLSALKEKIDSQTAYVALPLVTLHTRADNSSDTVAVPYREKVNVLTQNWSASDSGWIQLNYNGSNYYMWQNAGEEMLTTTVPTETYYGNTAYQQQVLDLALSYLSQPTKYAHNQSDGEKDSDGKYGFDCSGFASYVTNKVMQDYVPLYRLSASLQTLYQTTDIYNKGYNGAFSASVVCEGTLDVSLLQPGDVLFFQLNQETDAQTTGNGYNHCGIYLGNGEFIHCSHSFDGGVRIMPLSDLYADGFVAAKRYLPTNVTSAEKTMYTTSQKTNVYETNDSSAAARTVLAAEVPVVVEYTDNGNWSYVRYGDSEHGYILSRYLEESQQETDETRYCIWINQKLYASYSTNSDSVVLPMGAQVSYLGRYSNSSYYKFAYNGQELYAYIADGNVDAHFTTDYQSFLAGTKEAAVTAYTYLRSQPNSTDGSNVICALPEGSTVRVLTSAGSSNWTYVMNQAGQYGYVLSAKLSN